MCRLYVSNPNSSLCLQVCKIETGKSIFRIKLTKRHYNLKIMIKKLFIFNLIFIFSFLTLKAQPKNILLEGQGVIPDVEVKQSRQALLKGRDLQLEEAIKIITKQNSRFQIPNFRFQNFF